MGFIASADTLYAKAYLTDKGREYLFNKSNIRFDEFGDDLFEIKSFALGDPDINYKTTAILISGEVPDISGKSEGCLKTSVNYEQRNQLFYQNFDQLVSQDVEYNTNLADDVLLVSINTGQNDLPNGTDTGGSGTDDGGGSGSGGSGSGQLPNGTQIPATR
ncbi:MAG: hypothetical protein P8J32_00730 [bacterium]|nr:hypothetical protein [bacterium]